ncbi:MAG: LPS export ABC transporter periplasmic protein LptC [Mesorhizobium sp.]
MAERVTMDAGHARAGEQIVSRGHEAFARAQRHSRRVQAMKFWLPGLATVALVAFVGWSYLAIPKVEGVASAGAAVVEGKLVMANPKMDGFTKDNLPYTMTAARATQDVGGTGAIELEGIDATLPISAQNTAKIFARQGVFDNQKNLLTIASPIEVTTSDGIVAKFQSATVQLAAGSLSTPDPVDITVDGAHIRAESMSVSDKGAVMVFERRVRVDIDPKFVKKSDAKSGEANAAQ